MRRLTGVSFMSARSESRASLRNNAAKDDRFDAAHLPWLAEDAALAGSLDVLANDPGSARLVGVSALPPEAGAAPYGQAAEVPVVIAGQEFRLRVAVAADGTLAVDATVLAPGLDTLQEGESLSVTFWYAAQMGRAGTVSTACVELSFAGANNAPRAVLLASGGVDENAAGAVVGTLSALDPDDTAASFAIADERFVLEGATLRLRDGVALDFEATPEVALAITATDPHGATVTQMVTIAVRDVAELPTLALANRLARTPENGGAVTVAEIEVRNDPEGDAVLSLAGPDAAAFRIIGTRLVFVGGANYEAKASYGVAVQLDDPGTPGSPDLVETLVLEIADVAEARFLPDTWAGADDPNDVPDLGAGRAGTEVGDSLTGTAGNDILYGLGGNDTLLGLAGQDGLSGGPGADWVQGDIGDDALYGGAGNDTVIGSSGRDALYGGSGNDSLFGNADDDVLVGGFGADDLRGAAGNDVFRFLSPFDTNDTIWDFAAGDVLDFAALDANLGLDGDQAFAFVPAPVAAPSVVAHSLTWQAAGGAVTIWADMDGDTATAEFMLTVRGLAGSPEPHLIA